MIDCSRSMGERKGLIGLEGSKLDRVKRDLVELLRREDAFSPGDRVALMSFRGRPLRVPEVRLLMPLREVAPSRAGDRGPLEEVLALKASGGTPIGAGIREALRLLEAGEGRSRGVVLVTDGSNSEGENPALYVYEALRRDIRIDVVGLGASVDKEALRPLAEKTGGFFKHVTHADELSQALTWQRASASVNAKAEGRSLKGSLREKLRQLDQAYATRQMAIQEYAELRSNLESRLVSAEQESREKRAEASRELAGLHLEREKLMRELAELKARFDERVVDEETYLRRASPIEERIAWLNREITVRQGILRDRD
ncbi:MAG: VWA domain-containing protein [Candidatus Bathyarchaeia archaeon]